MHTHPSHVRFGLIGLALAALILTASLTWVSEPAAASDQPYQTYSPLSGPRFANTTDLRLEVEDIDLLGITSFETGYIYGETEVGGLSGLVFNQGTDTYTVISDDRSERNPARAYNLTINLDDGSLDDGDVAFASLISLENEAEEDFALDTIDAEGIATTSDFRFYIASEGNVGMEPPVAPFIREFSFVGSQESELPIPDKYLPQADGSSGIRDNLAFESLSISPNQRYLYAALENALIQDGEAATLDNGSPARILQYDLTTGQPIHEYLYMVDPIPSDSDPAGGFADNGLVDIQPLDDNGTFLAMERSYAEGVGNTIRLFLVRTQGAVDIMGIDSLADNPDALAMPLSKELLIDLSELGIQPDNVEGMAFGPMLADGRQSLILVSDNNFNPTQSTQFIGLALTFDATGIASPSAETGQFIDSNPADGALPEGTNAGAASEPVIWVHPSEPNRSLIFAALQEGGLGIVSLSGNTLATIPPDPYGSASYANVDVVYDFALNGTTIDLVLVTDSANDTLVAFAFEPTDRTIENVTSESMPASLFGTEDEMQNAHGLATYVDENGTAYAFVTQTGGNQVIQLALSEDDNGGVSAEVVRTITLPAADNASMAQGIAVDQPLGFLYVLSADGTAILKYSADAASGDTPRLIRTIDNDGAAMGGLSIYYAANNDGYLVTAMPESSSYALFERSGDNRYVGHFAIGEAASTDAVIDQANGTLGLDVVNVPTSGTYASGLLVVQDNVDTNQGIGTTQTNFKLVPWESIAASFAQSILVDTEGYQPR